MSRFRTPFPSSHATSYHRALMETIELVNQDILDAARVVTQFSAEYAKLPAEKRTGIVGLKIARILRANAAAADEIGNAQQDLADSLTQRDPDGKPVPVYSNTDRDPKTGDWKVIEGAVKLSDPTLHKTKIRELFRSKTELRVARLTAAEAQPLFTIRPDYTAWLIPFIEDEDSKDTAA